MRKIKFRVHTSNKGMIYNRNIDRFISIDSDGTLNNSGYPVFHIMQYTGINDNSGVEIYEGDYLVDRFLINDEDLSEGYNESLMPVMWCNKKHCWCVDVSFQKNGKRLEPIHSYFGNNLEVKGNIYEKARGNDKGED